MNAARARGGGRGGPPSGCSAAPARSREGEAVNAPVTRWTLREFLAPGLPEATLILGVGNRLRGDDGAGPLFAEACAAGGLHAVDCGNVPENHLGLVERARPVLVVLADAADFRGKVGDVAVVDASAIAGMGISTHGMPLSLVAGHILALGARQVVVLAFQPRQLHFGARMCPEVAAAVEHAARLFVSAGRAVREDAQWKRRSGRYWSSMTTLT